MQTISTTYQEIPASSEPRITSGDDTFIRVTGPSAEAGDTREFSYEDTDPQSFHWAVSRSLNYASTLVARGDDPAEIEIHTVREIVVESEIPDWRGILTAREGDDDGATTSQ